MDTKLWIATWFVIANFICLPHQGKCDLSEVLSQQDVDDIVIVNAFSNESSTSFSVGFTTEDARTAASFSTDEMQDQSTEELQPSSTLSGSSVSDIDLSTETQDTKTDISTPESDNDFNTATLDTSTDSSTSYDFSTATQDSNPSSPESYNDSSITTQDSYTETSTSDTDINFSPTTVDTNTSVKEQSDLVENVLTQNSDNGSEQIPIQDLEIENSMTKNDEDNAVLSNYLTTSDDPTTTDDGEETTVTDDAYDAVQNNNLNSRERLSLLIQIGLQRFLETNETRNPYIFWKNTFSGLESLRWSGKSIIWKDIFVKLREGLRNLRKESTPDTWTIITSKLHRAVSNRRWWPIVSILNKYSSYLPPTDRSMYKIAKDLREIIGSAAEEPPVCKIYGIFPDPDSCSDFYACLRVLGQWRAIKLECKNGEEFSASQGKCVSSDIANCGSQESVDSTELNYPVLSLPFHGLYRIARL